MGFTVLNGGETLLSPLELLVIVSLAGPSKDLPLPVNSFEVPHKSSAYLSSAISYISQDLLLYPSSSVSLLSPVKIAIGALSSIRLPIRFLASVVNHILLHPQRKHSR